METYPRDELFQTPVDELRSIAISVLYLQERRKLRLFLRQDEYGRYFSALVYLPRDRYTTAVRLRLTHILQEELGGHSVDFTAWNTESVLSRLHFVIRVDAGTQLPELTDADAERIESRLAAAARSWADGFAEALTAECGEERAAELTRRYADAFPDGYRADFAPRIAVADLQHIEGLGADDFTLSLYEPVGRRPRGAPVQDLPHRRPRLAVRGAARAPAARRRGRRRAPLRAAPLRPLPGVGLRLRAAAGPGARRPRRRRPRALPGGVRRDLDRPGGERRLQLPGAARRSGLAAGDGAARLRQVPAAGRLHLQPGLHGGHPPDQRPHHPAAGEPLPGPALAGPPEGRPGADRRHPGGAGRRAGPGREPGRGPHPALLPHLDQGDAAHQLLPEGHARAPRPPTCR